MPKNIKFGVGEKSAGSHPYDPSSPPGTARRHRRAAVARRGNNTGTSGIGLTSNIQIEESNQNPIKISIHPIQFQ